MAHKIAITQRFAAAPTYHEPRDALSQLWQTHLNELSPSFNLFPIPTLTSNIGEWLEALEPDAVILSNGEDWGENHARDKLESDLIAHCKLTGTPLLGACRGLQSINFANGGSVTTIGTSNRDDRAHIQPHQIQIVDDHFRSHFTDEYFVVNSFHNQAVMQSDLASNLKPFAIYDQQVEGLYDPEHAIMGIQWHPERDMGDIPAISRFIREFLSGKKMW